MKKGMQYAYLIEKERHIFSGGARNLGQGGQD